MLEEAERGIRCFLVGYKFGFGQVEFKVFGGIIQVDLFQ